AIPPAPTASGSPRCGTAASSMRPRCIFPPCRTPSPGPAPSSLVLPNASKPNRKAASAFRVFHCQADQRFLAPLPLEGRGWGSFGDPSDPPPPQPSPQGGGSAGRRFRQNMKASRAPPTGSFPRKREPPLSLPQSTEVPACAWGRGSGADCRRWVKCPGSGRHGTPVCRSPLADEALQDLLGAGLLEIDGQLVALDLDHLAIAEFEVEHPLAQREVAGLAAQIHRAGDQFPLDGQRAAAPAAGLVGAGALPAGGFIDAFEGVRLVEAAGRAPAIAIAAIGGAGIAHLHHVGGQFVEEARGD